MGKKITTSKNHNRQDYHYTMSYIIFNHHLIKKGFKSNKKIQFFSDYGCVFVCAKFYKQILT